MNTKEYLSQAWYLDKRIKTKEKQLDWLKTHAPYVSPNLAEAAKKEVSIRSSVEEAVVRIAELEDDIAKAITEMIALKREITMVIRSVNSIECETLLEMRYLTFLSWSQIAAELNYSKDYVYHLHRKALGLVKTSGLIRETSMLRG